MSIADSFQFIAEYLGGIFYCLTFFCFHWTPGDLEWTKYQAPPNDQYVLSQAIEVDNKLFVVGGKTGSGNGSINKYVDVFSDRQWHEAPMLPYLGRTFCLVVLEDSKIMIING